ncbi:MAG: TetR/AcrR family transcriptional regulator [Bacteroidetes bacterium]|nr:TetR/AcrR family transcriptional regulator [Bacteroidota bacterium]
MNETLNARDKILEVATGIFYKKGLAGARMQEIADEAGLNKAMLHYYFKTKEQLFNEVFEKAFRIFLSRIIELLNSDKLLRNKVSDYIDHTIDSLVQNPGISIFVIQELNTNPERVSKLFAGKGNINLAIFEKQISEEFAGKVNAEMFFTDMVAMCIYPFIAQPMLKKIFKKNDAAYKAWLQERKEWIKNKLLSKG